MTASNGHGMTLAEKVLARASGAERVVPGEIIEGNVDLAMMHEQGAQTVGPFHQMGAEKVWDPERVVIAIDHWVPASTEGAAVLHRILRKFAAETQLPHFYDVGRHGICHQILAENGWVVPGDLAVGTDSHTNMLGAMGAVATGIGPTEMAAVLALGQLWLKVPPTIQVKVHGTMGRGVTAKDLVLRILGEIKTTGATYKSVEYSGPAIEALSMPERFTICNMTTEMGAKCGMVAPDQKTFDYLAPIAKHAMHPLTPDADAQYERVVEIDLDGMPPMVACPYSPDNVRPLPDVVREHIKVDQVFLGSCTNARIEDLREGAALMKGRQVAKGVRFIVSPASTKIYDQCLKEGIIQTFTDAGAVFTNSSCSACFGGNMGILAPDEVCASSSNRNFPGRMGAKEARIYLMSPAATVAAAIRGEVADHREYLQAGGGVKDVIEGRVWTLGRDVDTDGIISGKYLTIIDPEELKKHVFEIALPEFAQAARPGDILVADENFGSGSSREHAPQAMKAIGVGAVVADSFARIFFRNAINLGLPTVEARGVRAIFEQGDTARIEMRAGRITNVRTGATVTFPPLPPHLLGLLDAGGLVEKVRTELAARKAAAAAPP